MSQFTAQQRIDAVAREIKMRERAYPRWCAAGRMTQVKADFELAVMRDVLAVLVGSQASVDPLARRQVEDLFK